MTDRMYPAPDELVDADLIKEVMQIADDHFFEKERGYRTLKELVFRVQASNRILKSIATMLGWVNVPPQHIIEAEIAALKARVVVNTSAPRHHILQNLAGVEDVVSYARRSVTDERREWTEIVNDEPVINASVGALCDIIDALCEEVERSRGVTT